MFRHGAGAAGAPKTRNFGGFFARFATQRKLPRALEMLVCAPTKGASTAIGADAEETPNQEIDMLSLIARWGHNVLLAGTGLLTVAFFYLAR
jgi:hypothetical protein